MKQFLVVKRQAGEGCDYTIGCGVKVELVQAESLHAAFFKVVDLRHDWEASLKEEIKNLEESDEIEGFLHDWLTYLPPIEGESALSEIDIYEVTVSLDAIPLIKAVRTDVQLMMADVKRSSKEDKEFKLYQELKKKFGDKDE